MKTYFRYIAISISFLMFSCEDVIDINLNDADPQLVIIGEVSNNTNVQQVSINRTVAFASDTPFDPVPGAEVEVVDGRGRVYRFTEETPGIYVANGFTGSQNERYDLHVRVDGQEFMATATMPSLTTADSIGTSVRNLFGEEEKFVSVKYQDPPGVANYYRYLQRVNGERFKMVKVANDKFNDGRYVSDDLIDFDVELVAGDSVVIQMQCIDKATFDFWNAVQSINPGTAAPANPPSVFGDGALGYFSAHAMSEISTVVQ
ncbi:DUF4249 domain-containing protein [Parapedobacter tibetensis]|uniref:DUF4249 domain-containing protein n=1 Tax=Parapedobacter tibetensis TaxID=2972951 RepID=UPI00214D2F5E|nr:DUF4249 domain-containing protein [Parapedobacter tibetensis]